MENFIEEPRHMDKATNTENGEKPKQVGKPKQQEEQEIEEDLIVGGAVSKSFTRGTSRRL